jgi:hypothetical protein
MCAVPSRLPSMHLLSATSILIRDSLDPVMPCSLDQDYSKACTEIFKPQAPLLLSGEYSTCEPWIDMGPALAR